MEELGINIPGLLGQIINFGLLLLLLYFLGYRPIMRMLKERQRRIEEGIRFADEAKKNAERAEEEFKKRLDEAGRKAREIIESATKRGEALREEIVAKAKEEAEALLERAREEIRREREEAIERIRKEFVDLSILAAEKVIKRSLDKETHRKIIEEFLEETRRG